MKLRDIADYIFLAVTWGFSFLVLLKAVAVFGSNTAARSLKSAGAWEITIGAFLSGGIMSLPLILAAPVPTTAQPLDHLYLVPSAR